MTLLQKEQPYLRIKTTFFDRLMGGLNYEAPLFIEIVVVFCGLTECDSCVNLLIDDIEILDRDITRMILELGNVSTVVLALRRLEQINNTVYELRVS